VSAPKPAASKPAKAETPQPEKKPAAKTTAPAKPSAAKAPVAPKPAPVQKPEPEPIIASTAPESKQAAIQSNALKQAEQRKAAKAQQEVSKAQKPISLPKITTTASRKYEPEFTRSVLDQPAQEPMGPSMRYSDAELQEFKDLITRKLETARKEIAYLHGMITRKDAMSGEDSDSRYMTMEDGSLSMEREQLSQMASRQHDFIEKLENALVRIENKTYGVCRVTGKLIDKARLRAVPHATLTVEAKKLLSKNPNQQ
jgi:RNA polymerase-binding transcription factor DksA